MSAATEMRSKFLAFAVAAALAAPLVPAQAAVSDFRLPDPSEQQPPPDRQGPVAPDVPESRRPAPTPTPTASTPTPSPVVAPPPVIVAPPISAAPTAEPTRPTPTQGRTSPPPSPVPTASTPAATASAEQLTPRPQCAPNRRMKEARCGPWCSAVFWRSAPSASQHGPGRGSGEAAAPMQCRKSNVRTSCRPHRSHRHPQRRHPRRRRLSHRHPHGLPCLSRPWANRWKSRSSHCASASR